MRLLAGLGNPGPRHAMNRHNIGFMAIDRIAAEHGFGPWTARFRAEVAEGRLAGEKVLLLKPQTYMNLSGDAVAEAARFYKLATADIVVVHDELDLPPGRCRTKRGGGHAGHNGLRSIMAHLGPDFLRIRLGIGHPGHKDAVAGYVLHDFAKADAPWLEPLLAAIAAAAPLLVAADEARFQNAVALKMAPARGAPVASPGASPGASQGASQGASSARSSGKSLEKSSHAAPGTTPAGASATASGAMPGATSVPPPAHASGGGAMQPRAGRDIGLSPLSQPAGAAAPSQPSAPGPFAALRAIFGAPSGKDRS
jgi:PTH1 family peptidyl-tRNA hydrolase